METHQRILDRALLKNKGSIDWRGWKAEEARQLVDLANKAERMTLLELNLEGDVNAIYFLRMPVPRKPVNGKLRLGNGVLLHLRYEESWRWESPPGWGLLGVLDPHDVYHSNVLAEKRTICLGEFPPGVPLKEIVLLGYFALTLQNVALNDQDPLGVLNQEACDFYRSHPEHLPLTSEGFLETSKEK